jgi:hypothetical protein
MKKVVQKSLAAALLIGFIVGFVNYVGSVHAAVKYDPPFSEDEYRRIRELPIEKAEAALRAREVKLSRTQWVVQSMGYSWFWWAVTKNSLIPILGVFVACLCVGTLLRPDGATR